MEIFGLPISALNYSDFFTKITKLEKQNIVFTPNPEILLSSLKDNDFKSILSQAHYLVPDGTGLYLAAQILDEKNKILSFLKLPIFLYNIIFNSQKLYAKYGEKICGSDLTEDLLHYAQEKNIAITIIDPDFPLDAAKCESQKNFKENMQKIFPTLKFDFYVYKKTELKEIHKKIAASDSKILFSTLGMKKQEQSVIDIMKECSNIQLGLGVGSSFDYFIGFQKRAPKVFRDFGLEWLYRIVTGPQKLKRLTRLWNAIVVFTYQVYKNK